MLNLLAIRTKNALYFTDQDSPYYLKHRFYNGKSPKESFDSKWFYIEGETEIVSVTEKAQPQVLSENFVLIDDNFSNLAPKVLVKEDACWYDEEDNIWKWHDKYKHLQSLYKLVKTYSEEKFQSVDFTFEILCDLDIDYISNPRETRIKLTTGKNSGTTVYPQHEMISKIIFPEIVVQYTPAQYTSKQVYDILREYIKLNIDNRYARIDSDYDFCFSVKKVISLSSPFEKDKEILKSNGKSHSPRRYNKVLVNTRETRIFEMTYSPENYKGYTAVKPMFGESEDDLNQKMMEYCKSIVDLINAPVGDCPHCDGQGVVYRRE